MKAIGRPPIVRPKLTPEQQRLVEDYRREWDPVLVLRKVYPGLIRKTRYLGFCDIDVESAAWEGVVIAAGRWDAGRGTTFATYALIWVRQCVSRMCSPRMTCKGGYKVKTLSGDATSEGAKGGEASFWDILGVSDPTYPQGDPDEFDRLDEIRKQVAEVFRFLSPSRRQLLELRFGLVDGKARTLEEVGEILGVTRERVRQLEGMALDRIRIQLQVRCFDYLKFGKGKMNNPTTEPADPEPTSSALRPTLGNCPKCNTPYKGSKKKRCFVCNPPYRPGQSKGTPRLKILPTPKPTSDVSSTLFRLSALEQAVAGLDRKAVQELFDYVLKHRPE